MSRLAALMSAMMTKIEEDYPDVEWGVLYSQKRYFAPLVVTPYVEVPSNCVSVTVKSGITTGDFQLQWFDSNKTYSGYWGLSQDPRTISFESHYPYLRLVMDANHIDDCYIKDNTNNTYLWKGKNV